MMRQAISILLTILCIVASCDRPPKGPLPWPEPKPEPYSWIPDEHYDLIQNRWDNASTAQLGSDGDDIRIRELILVDITAGEKKWIGELRWLSPNEIMATAFWYTSPTAAADYYYILRRQNKDWRIVTRYLLGVS